MFYLYNAVTGQSFNGVEFVTVASLDEVKRFDSFDDAFAAAEAEPFDHIKIRMIFS